MVKLVLLLDPPQDRDRVLDRGLADKDRLETALEGGVLFDVLAVLVERRGPDAMQFAARQRRLQHIRGVHRAFCLAGADEGVQLVDKEDDPFGTRGHFGQHCLEPFLELAAIFGAGQQRAEVERQQLFVLQALRHVAVDDALRQPLNDRGLSDTRLTDQHRVVLGPARQDLDRPPDLLVPTDHRIELAVPRRFGQVACILLERIVSLLGRSTVGLSALAHILDGPVEALRVDACPGDRLRRASTRGGRQREKQPFDRDKVVTCFLRQLLGLLENPRELGRHEDLAGTGSLDAWSTVELAIDRGQGRLGITPGSANEVGAQAFGIFQQDLEQMLRCQTLMTAPQRQGLRRLQKPFRPIGVFLEFHDEDPVLGPRCCRLLSCQHWQLVKERVSEKLVASNGEAIDPTRLPTIRRRRQR